MASSSSTYLSKEGKIFGPFTAEQLGAMKMSGEYAAYIWIWESAARKWTPTNPPPPPPPESVALNTRAQTRATQLMAVCHDHHQIISGALADVTTTGCTLQSSDRAPQPSLRRGTPVWLNLLDEEKGRSENLKAKILGSKRENDGWVYLLDWNSPPELLKSN